MGSVIGPLTEAAARHLGLTPGIAVTQGGPDDDELIDPTEYYKGELISAMFAVRAVLFSLVCTAVLGLRPFPSLGLSSRMRAADPSQCQDVCSPSSNSSLVLVRSLTGTPLREEIADENILQIVSRLDAVSDQEVQTLSLSTSLTTTVTTTPSAIASPGAAWATTSTSGEGCGRRSGCFPSGPRSTPRPQTSWASPETSPRRSIETSARRAWT